ncbi:AAA family ATPase [Lentzea chajnantorensis]
MTPGEIAERALERYLALPPTTARPAVVLVAGIPGAGKSTLAEGLARHLRAPVFSADWVIGALVPFEVLTDDNAWHVVDTSIAALLARQVQLGVDVVLDLTAHTREERARLRTLTERLGGVFAGVECVCSDETVHRQRVEGRDRGIPGWRATVPWEHVQRMRGLWEDWPEDHLVVDSAAATAQECLKQALTALGR